MLLELLIQLVPIPASILIARLLGPSDRGQLAEILLIPGIVVTLMTCNWDKILKGQLIGNPNLYNSIILKSYSLIFYQMMAALVIILIMYAAGFWANFLDIKIAIFVILCISFSQLSSNYLLSIYSCFVGVQTLYFIKFLGVFLYFILISLFLVFGEMQVMDALVVNQLTPIVYTLATVYIAKNSGFIFPKLKYLSFGEFINNFKNIHIVIFDVLANNIDVIILLIFANHGFVGAYLSFKFLEFPFRIINLSFINGVTPIFKSIAGSDLNKYSLAITLLIVISWLLLFLFSSYIDDAIILLLGEKFVDYLWMVEYVILYGALSNILLVLQGIFLMESNIKYYNQSVLLISSVKIIFVPLFFYFFGVAGVYAALVIASMFGILHYLNFKFNIGYI